MVAGLCQLRYLNARAEGFKKYAQGCSSNLYSCISYNKGKDKKSLLRDNTGKNVDFYLFKNGGIPGTYTAVCHRNKS
jgi:hypothetical protein